MQGRRRFAGRVAALALALCFVLPAFGLLLPARAAAAPPSVEAGAYLVMDAATGQVLVAGGEDETKFPASITKILTIGLVLEQVGLQRAGMEYATVSQAAVDALIPRASMVALQPGEELRVLDLLYATSVESANDAAHVLGEYVAGSMEAFAELMNQKAAELGLTGSHFTNSSGQPDADHYTTARDMAVITRWAMGLPGFCDILSATTYTIPATNKRGAYPMHNSNMIFQSYSSYYCEGVTGSKTGYTDAARYTLVTTASRGGTELICVVLDCEFNEQKYQATNALLDYCFGNFSRYTVDFNGIAPVKVPVYGGGDDVLGEIEVYAEGSAEYLLHAALSDESLSVQPEVPERYIIGQAFAPSLVVNLSGGGYQRDGELARVELRWRGLEEILAANTQAQQAAAAAAGESQPGVWLWVLLPALLVALFIGRVLYVKHRRYKRRMRRLAAARAQLPVRIAERPQPPTGPRAPDVYRARPARERLAMASSRPLPTGQAGSLRMVPGGQSSPARRARSR